MSHAVALIATGLGIGFAGSLAVTRILRKLLFEVTLADPLTFTAVLALLAAAGLTRRVFSGTRRIESRSRGRVAPRLICEIRSTGAK